MLQEVIALLEATGKGEFVSVAGNDRIYFSPSFSKEMNFLDIYDVIIENEHNKDFYCVNFLDRPFMNISPLYDLSFNVWGAGKEEASLVRDQFESLLHERGNCFHFEGFTRKLIGCSEKEQKIASMINELPNVSYSPGTSVSVCLMVNHHEIGAFEDVYFHENELFVEPRDSDKIPYLIYLHTMKEAKKKVEVVQRDLNRKIEDILSTSLILGDENTDNDSCIYPKYYFAFNKTLISPINVHIYENELRYHVDLKVTGESVFKSSPQEIADHVISTIIRNRLKCIV